MRKLLAWRPLLLAICALAALAQVADLADATGIGGAPPWLGRWGANTGASSSPFNLTVTSVDPAGPAARAGLRRGDLIDIRANTLVERYSLLEVPLNGRPLILSVRRGSLHRKLTVIPQALKLTWNFWLSTFAALWLLLFAALIAWRAADMHMRLLSLWIAAFVLTGALIDFAAPSAWVYVFLSVSAYVVGPLSVALLAAFASGFAQPLSRPRRITQWLCYAFIAIFAAISLIGTVGVITLRFDPLPLVEGNAGLVCAAAAVLMAVLCGVLAIAASRGVERQRAVWTLVPLASFFCLFILGLIASSSSLSYSYTILVSLVTTLVLLTAPVALTYAALSRRLIDVGFFLNRATVFTIVSAIVIGAFVLAEWAAGAWLAGTTRTASGIVGMVVALGLGISLRYIHRYVERFVDRVFFRKRHEDESALRRFAHEASYISDRSTLLKRAVQTVEKHTSAAGAAILLRDGTASYVFATDERRAGVGENDPAVVALRAWHKPVDLHEVKDSQLRGEFAFPMISRGDLVGALICGPKRDGETYAPDESEALLALARGVGTALDTLSSRSNGGIESIRETQTLMLQELQKLPSAIVSALREKNEKNG